MWHDSRKLLRPPKWEKPCSSWVPGLVFLHGRFLGYIAMVRVFLFALAPRKPRVKPSSVFSCMAPWYTLLNPDLLNPGFSPYLLSWVLFCSISNPLGNDVTEVQRRGVDLVLLGLCGAHLLNAIPRALCRVHRGLAPGWVL